MQNLPRIFTFAGVLSLIFTSSMAQDKPFVLEEATISSVHSAIKNQQVSCEDIVTAYIDRIKKYDLDMNNNRPPFNAITAINPNALEQARQLDSAYARTHQISGALYCIPVILKDNIDTYDVTTTSGSLALLGNQPIKDAFLVAQLRAAGAIILAKGAMDEFASGISGISSRNGRIGNAYNPAQNPGGSSGGVAVAVSTNFAMVGIGTDNSGSVRIPSAFNGLIGLRPTTGLISQNGILPRGNMDGTAGPIARTPEDLARVLGVVAHADPSDPKTLNISRTEDYTQFLVATGLNHKRIGIIQSVNGVNLFKGMPTDTLTTLQKGFKEMQKMGATLIPDIHLPHYDMNRRFNEAGEREDVNHYLASYPAARKNYAEICNSGRTSLFGTSAQCLTFIKNLPEKNSVQYQRALAIFKKNRTYVEGIMEKYHLDALLVPVSAYGSATYDDSTVLSEGVASNAGLPGITFTLGYTHSEAQMPIGIELIGKHLDEGPLIGMAYAWQKHVGPRQAPVMPAPDTQLSGLDIPALNNLFTLIGHDAYQSVLKNSTRENYVKNLPPEKFRDIVTKRLSEPLL